MFFTRWEVNVVQIITGSYNSGYGHEFERAFTRFDGELRQSMNHQRIVRYNLGGIECLVRFEVDAYIEGDANFNDNAKSDTSSLPAASRLSLLNQVKTETRSCLQAKFELWKEDVSSTQTPSLKSSPAIRRVKLKMKNIIPQLWISQTQMLFVGYHKEGLVEKKPVNVAMATHFRQWEAANQDQPKRMAVLSMGSKML